MMSERLLWISVIGMALLDAHKPSSTDTPKQIQSVRRWFNINNYDFLEVCARAGIDPIEVLVKYHKGISQAKNTWPRSYNKIKTP